MMKPQASFRGGRFGWEQAGLVASLIDPEHLAPWGPLPGDLSFAPHAPLPAPGRGSQEVADPLPGVQETPGIF